MRSELALYIERYLDDELGWRSRFQPWRRELFVHMEEAYIDAAAVHGDTAFDANVWKTVVNDFGDVRHVAREIQSLSGRHAFSARLALWGAAAFLLIQGFGSNPLPVLINIPSLVLVLFPAMLIAVFQAMRGTVRWDGISKITCVVAILLTVLGVYSMYASLDDASQVGGSLAVATLALTYALTVFAPGPFLQILMLLAALLEMGVAFKVVGQAGGLAVLPWHAVSIVPKDIQSGIIAMSLCAILVGMARFGMARLASKAVHIALMALLFAFILVLSSLDALEQANPRFALALACFACTFSACVIIGRSFSAIRARYDYTLS